MTLRLPGDGYVFLGWALQAPVLYGFAVCLILLAWYSRRESAPLFSRTRVDFPLHTLLYAIAGVLLLEMGLPRFSGKLMKKGMLLVRNLGVLVLIIFCSFAYGQSIRPVSLFGRTRPTARLLLLGVGAWWSLGIVFWFISFLNPFRLSLPTLPDSGPQIIVYLSVVSVLIPVTEELLFRGYFYPVLRSRIGITAGILVTSLVFAGAHGELALLPFLFIGALCMNLLYEGTGSVVPGWCLHSGFNALLYGWDWIMS